jgi:putative FmdB family regulatory protein
MPIYPIVCESCGKQDEVFAKMKDAGNLKCPACGGKASQDYRAKLDNTNLISDELPEGGSDVTGQIDIYQCGKTQVGERREALAHYGLGHVVRDSGEFVVRSRSEYKAFVRARGEMLRRQQEGESGGRAGWTQ